MSEKRIEEIPSPYEYMIAVGHENWPDVVYQFVERILNAGDYPDGKELARKLAYQHNTLQQNFMRNVVVPFLEYTMEKANIGFVDARNEATTEMAKKMLKAAEGIYLPGI